MCPRGDLNPETGEISPIMGLNSKTGEESPDRGFHAAMVAGAARLASSGLRPADRGIPADAGYGRTRLASRTVAEGPGHSTRYPPIWAPAPVFPASRSRRAEPTVLCCSAAVDGCPV
jgi:hypothetical protein